MRAPLRPGSSATLVALVLTLVLGAAATAGAATRDGATGDGVPVGLALLGALLGVLAFGARQWWERPGRGRR